jgi:hypothetical protein
MLDVEIQQAISTIHTGPHKLVLEFAGAGSLALWWLHCVAGSSATVLEATDRYAPDSLIDLLKFQPDIFVSAETAIAMAQKAYERAVHLDGTDHNAFLLGVACTATIATSYTKRGEHYCVIAVQSAEGITTYNLRMKKGHRDRTGEEDLVSRLLVKALVEAGSIKQHIPLELTAGEHLREHHHTFTDPIDRLMIREIQTVTVYPNGQQVANQFVNGAILSGSFNPLHHGHVRLSEVASELLGTPIVFELPIVNADKGTLTLSEIHQRLEQFHGENTVVLSRAPLFRDKALLFPGCVFIIGYDTAARLVSPYYYDGEEGMYEALETIRNAKCRFMVAGRFYQGQFCTIHDIRIPPMFRDMFKELAEDHFRVDISSTELRKKGQHTLPQGQHA